VTGAVALIGYGEAGRIFARDLRTAGVERILAYDILFDAKRPACAPPAEAAAGPIEAVAGADLVVSAVTAGSALAAAKSVAAGLRAGAIFLDVNSVSPGTKRAAFDVVEAAGGRYVEAAVMASVPPHGIGVPMLLGGPHAKAAAGVLAPLGFNAKPHAEEVGVASAVKMCRSVLIKGMEALLTEAMMTARRHGVVGEVLASLAETFPGQDWERTARYMIGRALAHGRRRAEEMREVARTVEEAGLSPELGLAIAARQDWAYEAGRGIAMNADLPALLDAMTAGLGEAAE
jgi:3-hydroxyisobutyrate dehydrogenase-like beta-hydroxyacid dehydrogenase